MNFTFDLSTIFSGTTVALLVYGIKGIIGIDRKVSAQNGRLGKIETWMTGHEKIDDERHKQNQEGFTSLWEKMDGK